MKSVAKYNAIIIDAMKSEKEYAEKLISLTNKIIAIKISLIKKTVATTSELNYNTKKKILITEMKSCIKDIEKIKKQIPQYSDLYSDFEAEKTKWENLLLMVQEQLSVTNIEVFKNTTNGYLADYKQALVNTKALMQTEINDINKFLNKRKVA